MDAIHDTAAPTPPLYRVRGDMPPAIAKAIVEVMGQIKTLGKEGENKFQHYNYTSVDQFYEAVGPLMAKAGIFTLPFEASMEVSKRETSDDQGRVKSSVWLTAIYDIYVYHSSGVQFGPIQRSIQVPASGAQAYASALSFIGKYFLRDLLKIPTGDDDDVDAQPKRELPAGRDERPPRQVDPETEKREVEEAQRDYLRRAKIAWGPLKRQGELRNWWAAEKGARAAIFGNDDPIFAELKEAFAARGAELEPDAPPADAKTDETGAPAHAPKPGEPPRPAIETMRIALREAVKAAKNEDEANDAYTRIVEPHEKQLEQAELADFVAILRHRVAEF